MHNKSWMRGVALVVAGVMIGGGFFLTAPANAQFISITKIWNKIKPKADKRYVKKVDRSKIVRTAGVSSSTSVVLTTTTSEVLVTSIKAPSKGFLVVQSTGTYLAGTVTPLVHCGLALDGDSDSWPGSFGLSAATTMSATGFGQCDVGARFPVAAGTHTVGYQVHNDGSGTLEYHGGALNVTFVAFGKNGGLGTGKPVVPHSHRDVAKLRR
jgi:hypothetical protein